MLPGIRIFHGLSETVDKYDFVHKYFILSYPLVVARDYLEVIVSFSVLHNIRGKRLYSFFA